MNTIKDTKFIPALRIPVLGICAFLLVPVYAGPGAACEETPGLECGAGSSTSFGTSTAVGNNATASGEFATATGSFSTSAGARSAAYGRLTTAAADEATALGHSASAAAGATAVGQSADADADFSTVIGHDARIFGGSNGSVVLGDSAQIGNGAATINAAAIGYRAQINQSNAMVLGSIPGVNNASSYVDVGIGTNTPQTALHIRRTNGTATMLIEEANVVQGPRDLFEISNNGNPEFRMTNIGNGNSWAFSAGLRFVVKNNAGAWVSRIAANGDMEISGVLTELSDVNAKQDIEPVDGRGILDKLDNLEISEWSYKDAPGDRHVGPMAQDFHAAFGLGHTDTGIATLDSSGIALAAIKALIQENEGLKQRIVELEQQNNRVSKLEAIVDRLVSDGKMQLVRN